MRLTPNKWSFSNNFLIFNIATFIVVKFFLPSGTLQLARLIDAMPAYDSREIITLTNEVRATYGKSELEANHKLDLAAQEKLNHMALEEYFAHVSPGGTTPWHWIKKVDYKYAFAGENLAIGFLDADDAVDAWMESSSHRANILNANYTEIGVAVATVEMDGNQGILVVQMFGKPSGTAVNPLAVQSSEIQQVAAANVESAQTQEPGITLQYVSTDMEIPAVQSPAKVNYREQDNSFNSGFSADNAYVLYLLVIAVISVVMSTMTHTTHNNLYRALVHVGLFVAAVLVPAISFSVNASIF